MRTIVYFGVYIGSPYLGKLPVYYMPKKHVLDKHLYRHKHPPKSCENGHIPAVSSKSHRTLTLWGRIKGSRHWVLGFRGWGYKGLRFRDKA